MANALSWSEITAHSLRAYLLRSACADTQSSRLEWRGEYTRINPCKPLGLSGVLTLYTGAGVFVDESDTEVTRRTFPQSTWDAALRNVDRERHVHGPNC